MKSVTHNHPQLFKVVGKGGKCLVAGLTAGPWSLPKGKNPGEWRSVKGKLVMCQKGLHLVDLQHVRNWFTKDELVFTVETRGPVFTSRKSSLKYITSEARLVKNVTPLIKKYIAHQNAMEELEDVLISCK